MICSASGATPLAMVDYIAVQTLDPGCLRELAKGLTEGALRAGISIPGGEIAQVKDVIKSEVGKEGEGFDLAGSAIGIVDLDRIIVGERVRAGDVIIGIESSGVHSNGLTLARKAIGQDGALYEKRFPELGRSLGEALLQPTHIYTQEVLPLLEAEQDIDVKALVHITGDGFLNLSRVPSRVTFRDRYVPFASSDLLHSSKTWRNRRPGNVRGVQHGNRLLSGGPGKPSRQDASARHQVWEKSLPARACDRQGS